MDYAYLSTVKDCPALTANDIKTVIEKGAAYTDPNRTLAKEACVGLQAVRFYTGHYRGALVFQFTNDRVLTNTYYLDGKSEPRQIDDFEEIAGLNKVVSNLKEAIKNLDATPTSPPGFNFTQPRVVFDTVILLQPYDDASWFISYYSNGNLQFVGSPDSLMTEPTEDIKLPQPGRFNKGLAVSQDVIEKIQTEINAMVINDYRLTTYKNAFLLSRPDNASAWQVFYYDLEGNKKEIPLEEIPGLSKSLDELPSDKFPEQLSRAEMSPTDTLLKQYRIDHFTQDEKDVCTALAVFYGDKITDTYYQFMGKYVVNGSESYLILKDVIASNEEEARQRAAVIYLTLLNGAIAEPLNVRMDADNTCKYGRIGQFYDAKYLCGPGTETSRGQAGDNRFGGHGNWFTPFPTMLAARHFATNMPKSIENAVEENVPGSSCHPGLFTVPEPALADQDLLAKVDMNDEEKAMLEALRSAPLIHP